MTDDDPIAPLEPALTALLESERLAEAPGARLEQIWSRVAAASVALPTGHGPKVTHGWLASHAAGVAAAAFVAGGGAGAALHASLERPSPAQIVYIDRLAPGPRPTPRIDLPIPSPPLPALTSSPAPMKPPTSPSPAPSASGSLAAERALLEAARADLSAGNAEHALSLVADHEHRFTRPQLAEEREALAVQSLVTLGRYDEARTKATRFKAASPQSLFMPAIEASLASIP